MTKLRLWWLKLRRYRTHRNQDIWIAARGLTDIQWAMAINIIRQYDPSNPWDPDGARWYYEHNPHLRPPPPAA